MFTQFVQSFYVALIHNLVVCYRFLSFIFLEINFFAIAFFKIISFIFCCKCIHYKVDRISQENQRMKLELEAFQKKYTDLEQFAKSIGKGNANFQDHVCRIIFYVFFVYCSGSQLGSIDPQRSRE